MTATLAASDATLRALAACLGNDVGESTDLPALLDAEADATSLDILYAGLRDGTFDHRNVPAHIGPIAGDGWHDRNDNAAALVSAALDEARATLAGLRGESR